MRITITRLLSDFDIADNPTNRARVAREAMVIASLEGVPLMISGLPKERTDRLLQQ